MTDRIQGFISIILRALTGVDEKEIKNCISTLKNMHGGTGFMHESFHRGDAKKFTRAWFAWANTLFGELIIKINRTHPHLLKDKKI